MAPRRGPATGLRAVTTTLAAAAILVSFLLSDAAAASPTAPSTSASPAPAPFRSPPPPPRQQATPATIPGATPPPERHRRAHAPRAAPPPDSRSSLPWHRRLNLGQKVGLLLVAVAIAMQVAFVAYLAVRARQLRRAANAEVEWSPRPAWQVARDSQF